MIQAMCGILGVGLLVLGLVGLGAPVPQWLAWGDFIASIVAFLIAGGIARSDRGARVGAPLALGGALYLFWAIAFTSEPQSWLAWWNFAFATAFTLVGLFAAMDTSSGGIVDRRQGSYGRYPQPPTPFGLGYPYGWGYGWGPYGPEILPGEKGWRGHRGQQSEARGPRAYRRADSRIQEDIYERLWDQWDIDASDIVVEVREGEATLTGQVDTREAKRRAEAIADSVRGVRDVLNRLSVVGTSSAGSPPRGIRTVGS